MTGTEAVEVAKRYARRPAASTDARYSMLKPDVWLGVQERQRALIRLLSRYASAELQDLKVLEIGCGTGANLLELLRLGFNPHNLTANELLDERAAMARRNLPDACRILEGDANRLVFEDASFDIVYQSTVFTSLLDVEFQRTLAQCMWRWLKPGGGVLWYDFVYDNPRNPDVRGVPVKRIAELFPQGQLHVQRVTLAPPISRRVAVLSPSLYYLLNSFPFLRTHVLCWIAKEQ